MTYARLVLAMFFIACSAYNIKPLASDFQTKTMHLRSAFCVCRDRIDFFARHKWRMTFKSPYHPQNRGRSAPGGFKLNSDQRRLTDGRMIPDSC
ncbi:unnamed protein product [Macrosiphum euphorbiae]|uniref:Secreted protein n=1 Tax=Macrosiphum euphorbiae TaxID=13131 RepID=A0AAV0X059_9HEMI|nr:unnamed protein product [Macrosiphum euphorbiae]